MIFSRQHLFFSGARFPLCEGLSLKDFFLFFSCNAFLLKWNFRLQRGWPVPSIFFSCVCGWRVCHLQVRGTAAKNPSFVRMDCRSMWSTHPLKKKKNPCVTPCELWCLGAGVKLKPEPSPSEARGRLHGLHDRLPPPPASRCLQRGEHWAFSRPWELLPAAGLGESARTLLGSSVALWGFPGGSVVKNLPANKGDMGYIPGSERSHRRKKWQPDPVFLLGKSHGQRSLADYSPWDWT